MKVCHISSAHGQEDTRIFHKECVSLAKAGYDVYQITSGKTYEKKGVNIVGIRNGGNSRLKRMLGTTKTIYKKALEIDAEIYHAHDPELLPIVLKLKKRGKIVVFDSHEHTVGTIGEKAYIPIIIRRLIQWLYEKYQTHVCRKIDAVVTATPNITSYFKSIGCKRVIDLCNFPIINASFCEPDYNSRCISFAGGISTQWNHDIIINAINNINDVSYVLCGSGEDTYIESLQKLDGWNKVTFKGRVPFEEVSVVLRHSAIGMSILTPGANTDWSNGNMANTKIFEEMMAGLPVICTDFRRWQGFVNEYDCGICVNPSDETQITKAIDYLINNPNEAKIKGINGRKAVEERFNWCVEEKKLLSLYKELEGEIRE